MCSVFKVENCRKTASQKGFVLSWIFINFANVIDKVHNNCAYHSCAMKHAGGMSLHYRIAQILITYIQGIKYLRIVVYAEDSAIGVH